MSNKLPNIIDPVYCSQHEKQYVVSIEQATFLRLVAQVIATDSDVEVSVKFYRNKKLRLPAFDMSLRTQLSLRCQRSLQEFEHLVSVDISGVFVESMALGKDVPEAIEIYEMVSEKISLLEIIEDELLLDIPLAPVDKITKMAYSNINNNSKTKLLEKEIRKETPFAVLKDLQKKH
jgi:uncharacterized protein